MKNTSWIKRLMALFLALCTIVGLLPTVGLFAFEADAAITDEISALVSELTAQYGDFKIPATKGYYSLDFDGLLAAELRQPVRATAYCGEKAVTGTLEYSASTYGKGKTGELGDLCKCLMSYSDSAKTYFAQ